MYIHIYVYIMLYLFTSSVCNKELKACPHGAWRAVWHMLVICIVRIVMLLARTFVVFVVVANFVSVPARTPIFFSWQVGAVRSLRTVEHNDCTDW